MATARSQQEAQKLAAEREHLQDEHGITEAEAGLVQRLLADDTKADVDDVVAQVLADRVGPAAATQQSEAPQRPRLAPHTRIDDVEARITALEQELAAARRERMVVESPSLRVSQQGTTTTDDPDVEVLVDGEPAGSQTAPSDVDKGAKAAAKEADKK